ncbi:diaminopimelate decarboxylase [Aminipila luticellarii]|uniref:Diaminopimelate decarboxylase n=1 Tax=Aminipila luticellarii TaxID=2507160 RepID=A0A410PY84_9FIRM|nr:diaminopimelate decarboxylase [Aminipila luticellarii]QAT43927.1 diaminopimelate decarboxylase [Aminipila luticellarii]
MNNKDFIFDGCNMTEIAAKYGTPLYVMSESSILKKCQEIKSDFLDKYPNTRAVFASKAFQTLEICRMVVQEGLGLDTVSGGEIYTAHKAGVPMEFLDFHGNNKTLEEIKMAVDYNVGRIVVDNLYELEALQEYAQKVNKKVKILFRITPGVDCHTHKFITTGQLDSKFGIPLENGILKDFIRRALDMENIELMGFHFHVGSQLATNESHLAALNIALDLMKDVKQTLGFETKELNIGGGFGIHYTGDDKTVKVSEFMDPIMNELYAKCDQYQLAVPQITIEPGRWIVGEAGVTLYTVGSIKEIPGIRKYIGVDGGMTDNIRPGLYGAKYQAVLANKMNQASKEKVTIAGKCCESTDILIYDMELPEVESGDTLAVFSTGAYCYSMSSNYNKIPRPAVVMVKDGKDRLIVKRETYEDMISREI